MLVWPCGGIEKLSDGAQRDLRKSLRAWRIIVTFDAIFMLLSLFRNIANMTKA